MVDPLRGGGGAAASSTSPWLTPSPTAFRAPAAWSPGVKGGAGWTWHLFSMISVSGKFTAAARGDQRFAGFWSRRAEVLDRQGLPRAPFRVRHPRHVSSDRPRGHSHDGVDPLAVHGAFAVAFDSPVQVNLAPVAGPWHRAAATGLTAKPVYDAPLGSRLRVLPGPGTVRQVGQHRQQHKGQKHAHQVVPAQGAGQSAAGQRGRQASP